MKEKNDIELDEADYALWKKFTKEHLRAVCARCNERLACLDGAVSPVDAVGDALVKAWKSRDKYDARKGALESWIFSIADNICTDIIRDHFGRVRVRGPLIADGVCEFCKMPIYRFITATGRRSKRILNKDHFPHESTCAGDRSHAFGGVKHRHEKIVGESGYVHKEEFDDSNPIAAMTEPDNPWGPRKSFPVLGIDYEILFDIIQKRGKRKSVFFTRPKKSIRNNLMSEISDFKRKEASERTALRKKLFW